VVEPVKYKFGVHFCILTFKDYTKYTKKAIFTSRKQARSKSIASTSSVQKPTNNNNTMQQLVFQSTIVVTVLLFLVWPSAVVVNGFSSINVGGLVRPTFVVIQQQYQHQLYMGMAQVWYKYFLKFVKC
jgi:hypothetical protein